MTQQVFDLNGVKPLDYNEWPDLTGAGQLRQKAQYVVKLHGKAETYDSVKDDGSDNGQVFKIPVTIESASGNAACNHPGTIYQIRLTGFGKHDKPKEPEKSSHARACRKLRGLIAAVTGYQEIQLDAQPGAWQAMQQAFHEGSCVGRVFGVTVTDAQTDITKGGFPYYKYVFQPITG